MTKQIDVDSLFDHWNQRTLIDVRTPAEFVKGHIPGANNLPLFSDEERVVVGTTYKQQSPEEALLKGLEFVGPKMRFFIERVKQITGNKQLIIHCWRGGRRSESMGWLLNLAGFEVMILKGGYKAYRNYILNFFASKPLQIVVLGGYTGSGKTAVLRALAQRGEQVIDLERLAHHKGSTFGALGEGFQPTVEQFENDLFSSLNDLDHSRRIWVEDESQSIGRVYIPVDFWMRMREAPIMVIDIPKSERIRYLVDEYAGFSEENLAEAFTRIKKRLGGQHLQDALDALKNKDFSKAVSIGLTYYDKAYLFGLNKRSSEQIFHFETSDIDPERIADQLLQFANRKTSAY